LFVIIIKGPSNKTNTYTKNPSVNPFKTEKKKEITKIGDLFRKIAIDTDIDEIINKIDNEVTHSKVNKI